MDNATPQSADTRVDRLRYVINMSKMTQAQFAKRIGINASNLSKYLLGKLPINDTLINRVVLDMGISRNWLRDGVGVPFEKDFHATEITVPSPVAKNSESGIPVYDVDVTAGSVELSRMFTDDRIIGRVSLPRMNPDSLIVRVSGDSMEPVIRDGSYINIRRVTNPSIIFWGQIYVVLLEDYRMVKFVRKHHDPSKVILHSANPEYDDIDIPRADIAGLYIVEAVLNYDLRC